MDFLPLGGHRRITIMGLGLFGGGVGAARFWARLGSHVTVTDLRDADTLASSIRTLSGLSIRYVLGRHEEADFTDADVVIVNPAVPPENRYLQLAQSSGAQIQTEVGLAMRLFFGPVLAVTGSNGKSTTTALLGAMLRCADPNTLVGGNIGGSLLDQLPTHKPSSPMVVELSSFQLHYLKEQRFAPDVAVVTNLSPNHLDWHKSMAGYVEDKKNLIRFQGADQWAVLNLEDPLLREWAADCPARVLGVSMEEPDCADACFAAPHKGEAWIHLRVDDETEPVAPLSLLRVPGAHNQQNALLAAAAAYAYRKERSTIAGGLLDFNGLPHRLETVATVGGVRFVNDSISTTPESTLRGLESFDCPVVWIGGGYDKGIDLGRIAPALHKRAQAAVLVGATASAIGAALAETTGLCAVIDVGTDFEQAVRVAYANCPAGGVVLLSPACASYDMFENFQQRGERFTALARSLTAADKERIL